jgi:hypothetical protein
MRARSIVRPGRPWASRGAIVAPLLAVLLARPLSAAEPGEDAPQPATDDDMTEILKALGQDAAAREDAGAAPAALPAPVAGSAGSGLMPTRALNPAIALIGDFALAWFSDDEPTQRGGHDPTETGFNLQQLELSLMAAIDPYFRFDANIVFGLFGVEVEEAYGTTLALPWNLQARAGQFLSRFGRLNNTHPHAWDFADQPLVSGKFFGSEGQRGLGLELSALLPLPWYVEVVGTALMPAGGANMRSFYGNDDLGVDHVDDLVYVVALKQFFPLTDDWSLAWGLSGAFGPNPTGRDNRSEIYGTDLFLKWRPIGRASYQEVSLEAELLLRRRQVPGGVLQDGGGFAQLVWRFDQRWATGARYEYLSGVAGDWLDPDEDDREQRAAVNVTFWPTEFSRLRVQYSASLPAWREDVDVVHAVFLTLELVAGAHGAHTF